MRFHRLIPVLLLGVFLLATIAFSASNLTGNVVGISDGDTITVLVDQRPIKIRLHGIDCPEHGQPFGQKAKQFTSDLAFKKTVTVRQVDKDKYGRIVGDITLPDGSSLNREIIKAGYAWWFRQYSTDASLGQLEDEARRAKIGLWADPNPIAPWEWRKGEQTQRFAQKKGRGPKSEPVTIYHGNVKSGIFHGLGCRYYDCKNCTAEFKSREEAIGAGYRPCKVCRP
jgi:endonuclease YncB( thermonuclease family)